MGVIPQDVVREAVAGELAAATAWGRRYHLPLTTDIEALRVTLALEGPGVTAGDPPEGYLLCGEMPDFPALPPIWRFVHPVTGEPVGIAAYPASPGPTPFGAPMFIDGGIDGAVICAHFSRLAYADEGGVHRDWGAISNWRNAIHGGYAVALTVGAMLDRIWREMPYTRGRRAQLEQA